VVFASRVIQTLINWCESYDRFGIDGLTTSKISRNEYINHLQKKKKNKKLKQEVEELKRLIEKKK